MKKLRHILHYSSEINTDDKWYQETVFNCKGKQGKENILAFHSNYIYFFSFYNWPKFLIKNVEKGILEIIANHNT